MSLSAVMSALAEYVGQILVDECDRPAPNRVLRYFGTDGLPQDCCTEAGTLSVSWDRGYPTGGSTTPFPADASGRGEPCPAHPTYVLAIRYDVCWKAAQVDESGVTIYDETWDADAAVLADVADCVARALLRLQCSPSPAEPDPETQDLLDTLFGQEIRYQNVTPSARPGDCARLTWRLYASPLPASAAAS